MAKGTHDKQYNQNCHKCCKYSCKPGNCNFLENEKEHKNDDKKRKMKIEQDFLMVTVTIVVEKGIRLKIVMLKK